MRRTFHRFFGSLPKSNDSVWNMTPVFDGKEVKRVIARVYGNQTPAPAPVNASGVEFTTSQRFAVEKNGYLCCIGTLGDGKEWLYKLDQRKFEEAQKNNKEAQNYNEEQNSIVKFLK